MDYDYSFFEKTLHQRRRFKAREDVYGWAEFQRQWHFTGFDQMEVKLPPVLVDPGIQDGFYPTGRGATYEVANYARKPGSDLKELREWVGLELPEDFLAFYRQYAEALVVTHTLAVHLWPEEKILEVSRFWRSEAPVPPQEPPYRFFRFADYADDNELYGGWGWGLWQPAPGVWKVVSFGQYQWDRDFDPDTELNVRVQTYLSKPWDSFEEWLRYRVLSDGLLEFEYSSFDEIQHYHRPSPAGDGKGRALLRPVWDPVPEGANRMDCLIEQSLKKRRRYVSEDQAGWAELQGQLRRTGLDEVAVEVPPLLIEAGDAQGHGAVYETASYARRPGSNLEELQEWLGVLLPREFLDFYRKYAELLMVTQDRPLHFWSEAKMLAVSRQQRSMLIDGKPQRPPFRFFRFADHACEDGGGPSYGLRCYRFPESHDDATYWRIIQVEAGCSDADYDDDLFCSAIQARDIFDFSSFYTEVFEFDGLRGRLGWSPWLKLEEVRPYQRLISPGVII